MKWEHRCSLDWMVERQRYLTASDIKSLLPVTKTGRVREVSDAEYLRVMANKMVTITEEDCISYGAAARGHLLEPYAVEALNQMLFELNGNMDEQFHHWDDKVISLPKRLLAFSPDAMNVPQSDEQAVEHVTAIAEVKSYGAEKHLSTAYTPKDQIEERWQIATPMALLPNIDHGYLVLFNPKMRVRKTFLLRYDRDELEREIELILEVEDRWGKWRETSVLTRRPDNGAIFSHYGGNEDTIARKIEQRQRLNP